MTVASSSDCPAIMLFSIYLFIYLCTFNLFLVGWAKNEEKGFTGQ